MFDEASGHTPYQALCGKFMLPDSLLLRTAEMHSQRALILYLQASRSSLLAVSMSVDPTTDHRMYHCL